MELKFNATKEEFVLISKIADRALKMAPHLRKMDVLMDIEAAHSNGCALRLGELATADDFNFSHDVFGIIRHIDRDTGKLGGCFLPRFSR